MESKTWCYQQGITFMRLHLLTFAKLLTSSTVRIFSGYISSCYRI